MTIQMEVTIISSEYSTCLILIYGISKKFGKTPDKFVKFQGKSKNSEEIRKISVETRTISLFLYFSRRRTADYKYNLTPDNRE